MRIQRVLALALVVVAAWPVPLLAGVTAASDTFAVLDAKLRARQWEVAHALAVEQVQNTRGTLRASHLGGAVARLAVAEAGLGRTEDAIWHWQVAQNLDRGALSAKALASFGDAGATVARHPLRQAGEPTQGATVYRADGAASGIQAARKLAGDPPALSAVVLETPIPKALHVEAIVDAEGRLRAPVVIGAGAPGMIWEALEALRGWRYEPARKGGEAVAVYRDVRLNPPARRPLAELVALPQEAAIANTMLRAGNWKDANAMAQQAWRAALGEEQPQRERLAAALTLRALAEAGTAEGASAAVCRWQAAQHVDERLYNADLAPYGFAGGLLERHRWGSASRPTIATPSRGAAVKKWRPVAMPKLSTRSKVNGAALLTATVDERGGLHQPLILSMLSNVEGETAFSYAQKPLGFAAMGAVAALDELCSWTVAPARAAGRPVSSDIVMSVGFGPRMAGPRMFAFGAIDMAGGYQNRAVGSNGWAPIGPAGPPVPPSQRP